MIFGSLTFQPLSLRFDLVAGPTRKTLEGQDLAGVEVAEIDDDLADTAEFCEQYGIGLDVSANCVIVEAKRGDKVWHAACIVLATTRADINNVVRRHLDARKISFAPMDTAVSMTGMMYGGITPIGLPSDWPILIDTQVAGTDYVVIGSGLRKSKLLAPGKLLARLPTAQVLDIAKAIAG